MNSCGLRRSTHHPSGEVERKPTVEHEAARTQCSLDYSTQRLLALGSTRSLNHLSPLENFSLCKGSIGEQINSPQECFIPAEKKQSQGSPYTSMSAKREPTTATGASFWLWVTSLLGKYLRTLPVLEPWAG